MRWRVGIVLPLIWLLAMTGVEAKPFRFSVASEPPTLDWNLATDNVSYQILQNLMEGLTAFDDQLQPVPALARTWKVSPDGLLYTFHLRTGIRWSDGQPLVAQHFVDSWLRLLRPETAAEYAYFLYDIEGAREFNRGAIQDPSGVKIQAFDAETVQVKLKHPAVFFPAIVAFMVTFPIRLDIVERYGDNWTEPQHLVTLGPFRLTGWRHEYRLTFGPNFAYRRPVSLESVQVFVINEATTALSLYETGDLDYVELPPLAIPQSEKRKDFRRQPKLRGYYYGFNLKKPPFDDVRVRQAFAHAIDRREFPRILRGGEIPVTSWIPPGMFGFHDKIGLAFDVQEAKRLFAAAGYPDGKGFPRVTATFNTDPTNRLIAENFQSQIKRNLNVEVVLDNQEWKMYLKNLDQDPPPIFRLGWGADYPDPDNFMNLFTSYSGNNHTGWENPLYDQWIERGVSERNERKRKAIYDEAQRLLCEKDTVIMPFFVATTNFLADPDWQDLQVSPLGYIDWQRLKRKGSF